MIGENEINREALKMIRDLVDDYSKDEMSEMCYQIVGIIHLAEALVGKYREKEKWQPSAK